MKKQDNFNFWVPIEFEKSVDPVTKKKKMIFSGIASDDSKDADDEILEPSGFELKNFLESSFINYNHGTKNSPKSIVGEPLEAKIVNNKFVVKGMLYDDSKLAHDIWETAEMLEKSGSKRRLGFSIEGTPLKRDLVNPKRILKARITGLAITANPKNRNTIFQLVKGEQAEDFIDYEYEFEKSQDPNGGEVEYLVDINDVEKGVRVTMDKDLTIKIEKAITTDSPSGKAMKKESLEDDLKNLSFGGAIVTLAKAYEQGMISEEEKDLVAETIIEKSKGKKGIIGEIRTWNGKKYKKQPNGKWMEVSESHGKTSKEHREEAEKIIDNGGFAAGAEGHIKHAEKLSDKEHDESELETEEMRKKYPSPAPSHDKNINIRGNGKYFDR